MLAPICFFTYNRLTETKQTISALQKNYLASQSKLIIFSDGPRDYYAEVKVKAVREYLKTVEGFLSIEIVEFSTNKGLANSIISGVTDVMNQYGVAIVLEDDLITAPNFLSFMNQALEHYKHNLNVFSISGFIFDIKKNPNYHFDVFFTKRHCSWGWAMWKDRWDEIDWSVSDYEEFKTNKRIQNQFKSIGGDLVRALHLQQRGETNSWAIRCNYHQAKKQTYTLYPLSSKVVNIGFGEDATHTRQKLNKYHTALDRSNKLFFTIPDDVVINTKYINNFKRRYSLGVSIYYYLVNKIFDIFS